MLRKQYSKVSNPIQDSSLQLGLPDPDLQSRSDANFLRARERFRTPKHDGETLAQALLTAHRTCIAAGERHQAELAEVERDKQREQLLDDVRERFGPDEARDGVA